MLHAFKNRFLKKKPRKDEVSDGNIICTKMNSSDFGKYIPNGILGKVRVVFLSDIHCKQYKVGFGVDVTQPNTLTPEEKLSTSIESLPCGDILIISGDFVESGLMEELVMFNMFLKNVSGSGKFKHIVFICGNHERTIDIDFYNAEGWRYHETRQDVQQCRSALFDNLPANVHYLFDSHVMLEGMKIYGTPWVVGGETFSSESSSSHFRWAYSLTEEELIEKYDRIPVDVDVLVTHMPPYGIGDGRRNYDKDYFDADDRQVFGYDCEGSHALRKRVGELRGPLVHCYGHIHSGYGAYRPTPPPCAGATERQGGRNTLFVNAANCDEDYVPIHPALVADLSPVSGTADTDSSDLNTVALKSQQSKERLDRAVALLVVVEDSRQTRESGVGLADLCALKASARSFLRQALREHSADSAPTTAHSARKKRKAIDSLVELEEKLASAFTRLSLLEGMWAARRLSQGANEESSEDFRGMQLVVPNLFIGSVTPSQCKETLDSFGITHVVNCFKGWEPSFPEDFVYLTLPVEDDEGEDLSGYFIDSFAFIDVAIHQQESGAVLGEDKRVDSARDLKRKDTTHSSSMVLKNNNVYVHCQLGISRSAAVVIAYLMFTLRLTYRSASTLLKRARPFVCPNQGFVDQLLQFEASLRL